MTKHRNAHEYAAEHGMPWISGHSGNGGYDTPSRGGKSCDWLVHARPGKSWKLPDDVEVPLREGRNSAGGRVSTTLPFVTLEEAQAFVVRQIGHETGWKIYKEGLHPDPKANDVPCGKRTWWSQGLASGHRICFNRRREGEEVCGFHASVERKAAEKAAAHNASTNRSEENRKSARGLAQMLEDEFDIPGASPDYHSARSFADSGYTGNIVVDGEKLRGLLIQLRMAREILGDDMPGSGWD